MSEQTPAQQSETMRDAETGNWHEITGPNGMCACGTEHGACGDRLARYIESIRRAAVPVKQCSNGCAPHESCPQCRAAVSPQEQDESPSLEVTRQAIIDALVAAKVIGARQAVDRLIAAAQLRAAVSGEGISLAAIAAGLTKYVVDNGAGHDDDCPADDTCECSQKFVNDAVNAACRVLNILSQLPLVAPQEDK